MSFIIVSPDELFIKAARAFSINYPHDRILPCGSPGFFTDEKGEVVLELDGSLPTRATFLGHSKRGIFADVSIEEFIQLLLHDLDGACRANPEFRASLKKIDFISCEIGLSNLMGESDAKKISDALLRAGYDIKIHALTNTNTEEKIEAAGSVIGFQNHNIYINLAFKTQEKMQEHLLACSEQNLILQIFQIYQNLMDINFSSTPERFTQLLNFPPFNTSEMNFPLFSFEKKINFIIGLMDSVGINVSSINTTGLPAEIIQSILTCLNVHAPALKECLSQIDAVLEASATVVDITTDPRVYVDKNHFCLFTPDVKEAKTKILEIKEALPFLIPFQRSFNELKNLPDTLCARKLTILAENIIHQFGRQAELKFAAAKPKDKIDLMLKIIGECEINVLGLSAAMPVKMLVGEISKRLSALPGVIAEREKTVLAVERRHKP